MSWIQTKDAADIDMGRGALVYWGLKRDLLNPGPLYLKNPKSPAHDFFIKTRTITAIKDIKNEFEQDVISRIILLLGNRGSGKTTAMNYLESTFELDNAFINCPVHYDSVDLEKFRKSIHSDILLNLVNFLEESPKAEGIVNDDMTKRIDEKIQ